MDVKYNNVEQAIQDIRLIVAGCVVVHGDAWWELDDYFEDEVRVILQRIVHEES